MFIKGVPHPVPSSSSPAPSCSSRYSRTLPFVPATGQQGFMGFAVTNSAGGPTLVPTRRPSVSPRDPADDTHLAEVYLCHPEDIAPVNSALARDAAALLNQLGVNGEAIAADLAALPYDESTHSLDGTEIIHSRLNHSLLFDHGHAGAMGINLTEESLEQLVHEALAGRIFVPWHDKSAVRAERSQQIHNFIEEIQADLKVSAIAKARARLNNLRNEGLIFGDKPLWKMTQAERDLLVRDHASEPDQSRWPQAWVDMRYNLDIFPGIEASHTAWVAYSEQKRNVGDNALRSAVREMIEIDPREVIKYEDEWRGVFDSDQRLFGSDERQAIVRSAVREMVGMYPQEVIEYEYKWGYRFDSDERQEIIARANEWLADPAGAREKESALRARESVLYEERIRAEAAEQARVLRAEARKKVIAWSIAIPLAGLLAWGPGFALLADQSYTIEHNPAHIVMHPEQYDRSGFFFPLFSSSADIKAAVQSLLKQDPHVLTQHTDKWMPYYEDKDEAQRILDRARTAEPMPLPSGSRAAAE